MWRGFLISILLAGCVQLPPTPQDIQAKKFERVPDKAVIYVVRSNPDAGWRGTPLVLDDAADAAIFTYPGTYLRWEVAPGVHSIRGMAGDSGMTTLQTESGKIYFLRQDTGGGRTPVSRFQAMSEQDGRAAVQHSWLTPSR